MPAEWKEAKIIILHKKGYMKYITNYIPISLSSHMYKLFTRILQKQMENVHNETNKEKRPVSEKFTRQLIAFKQSTS